MEYVVKRDGRTTNFEKGKIVLAILKAFKAVDGEITEYAQEKAEKISNYIEKKIIKEEKLDVETIQDLVEKGLMATKRKDVARAYITYRNDRARARNWNTNMMQTIKEKLEASNVENQNANVDEQSFGGRRGEASAALMKQFALDNCMSEMSRNNHLNNEIYIHKLNCA